LAGKIELSAGLITEVSMITTGGQPVKKKSVPSVSGYIRIP
jgi:hypothetical protein